MQGRSSICVQDSREDGDIIDGLTEFNTLEGHGVGLDSPSKLGAGYGQPLFRLHF